MNLLSDWIDEFYGIIEKNETVASMNITSDNVHNRVTILVLGLFFSSNTIAQVNVWLKHFGFSQLTYRNRLDSFFIYSYVVLSTVDVNKRLLRFIDLAKEYIEWENSSFNEKVPSPRVSYKIHPDIITFGDLRESLARHSSVTNTSTMQSNAQTERNGRSILYNCIKNGQSLSYYLDIMLSDDTLQEYNYKSTYYIQRMLYDMIKSGLDILYENHLLWDKEDTTFINRKYLIKESSNQKFNRWIDFNRLFIKNIKSTEKKPLSASLKGWVKANPDSTINDCINSLASKELFYVGLFRNIYDFFMQVTYNDMLAERDGSGLSKEQYFGLWGEGKNNMHRMETFLRDVISGNISASREFLILFGFYSGYNREQIENALQKSGYPELDEKSTLDKTIIAYLNKNYIAIIRKKVNKKNFINRQKENTSNSDDIYIGLKERKDFYNFTDEFRSTFNDMLRNCDSEFLSRFFKNDKIKTLIETSDKDLELITKRLENTTNRMIR